MLTREMMQFRELIWAAWSVCRKTTSGGVPLGRASESCAAASSSGPATTANDSQLNRMLEESIPQLNVISTRQGQELAIKGCAPLRTPLTLFSRDPGAVNVHVMRVK